MLDLSNEEQQVEFIAGPVPCGSIVLCKLSVVAPKYPAPENINYSVAKSGLRQVCVEFCVYAGEYNGYSFREFISLPAGEQKVQLTQGQNTSCRIGGARLKAICTAARKQPKMQDITSLNGLTIPVKVGINDIPYLKDGIEYWNNNVASIVTPDKEEYQKVMSGGEILTDGAIVGRGGKKQDRNEVDNHSNANGVFHSERENDEYVPF